MYKTGDLARHRLDGTLEFLGRLDHQVKLRGFRIELGEIEATLEQHAAVEASVVLVHTPAHGEPQLLAYVVLCPADTPEASDTQQRWSLETEWRALLSARLPGYMVPNAFVVLEALPLTPNGKIDRHRLPAPAVQRGPASSYVAPRDATETLLARIWQDVLRVEQVGIHDHFFLSGGHSLLATQVLARVRQQFQVELPLRTIFGSPTVAGLAEQIERALLSQNIQQAPDDPSVAREEITI